MLLDLHNWFTPNGCLMFHNLHHSNKKKFIEYPLSASQCRSSPVLQKQLSPSLILYYQNLHGIPPDSCLWGQSQGSAS